MSRTRVLICEDSRTYSTALCRALEHEGDIEVVGVARTGEDALVLLGTADPDVLTMDIELPGIDGLEAVEQIMGTRPRPILIISSHLGSSSQMAAAALAAGALDAVSKETLDLLSPSSASSEALRSRIRQLSHIRVIRHLSSRLLSAQSHPQRARTASVIGICASTGGPQALVAVLEVIPGDFQIPILVVQHMAAGFHEGLANWLDTSIPLSAHLLTVSRPITSGVWIAGEGADLVLGRFGVLVSDRTSPPEQYRPSGDALLRSVAKVAGDGGVAVVLSGMGRDGADGARAVHRAGGTVLAQSEASCAVYGMPKAAAEEAAAVLLAPDQIGLRLARLRSSAAIS